MSDSTAIQVRLAPDKLAYIDSEAARLGVPRATVIQMLITQAARQAHGGRSAKGE